MSISRRRFFKGLMGGLGSLGLANVILSKQGWLGFLQPAKALADIPPPYDTYTLLPQFQFFQGDADKPGQAPVRDGAEDPPTQNAINKWNAFTTYPPMIIKYSSANPSSRSIRSVYQLSPSQAFVTRLLLMGVDTSTLSQMYVSRFGVQATPTQTPIQRALTDINEFIRNNNFFRPHNYPNPGLPGTKPIAETAHTAKIWADFSIGSVYAVKAIKYP